MEHSEATELLAALGHDTRLAIFRLLVEAGAPGLNATTIGERLGTPAPTLSFHLAHLSRVGLIRGERQSRFINYSTAYETMDALIEFLTHDCCQGEPCLPSAAGKRY
jgi:ArsR family transcriptional regulator